MFVGLHVFHLIFFNHQIRNNNHQPLVNVITLYDWSPRIWGIAKEVFLIETVFNNMAKLSVISKHYFLIIPDMKF